MQNQLPNNLDLKENDEPTPEEEVPLIPPVNGGNGEEDGGVPPPPANEPEAPNEGASFADQVKGTMSGVAIGSVAGGVLVAGGFLAIGLMPFVGPIAGGWFAANMGAGLVAGSAMSVTQSLAMTGAAYYTGAAVGGGVGGIVGYAKSGPAVGGGANDTNDAEKQAPPDNADAANHTPTDGNQDSGEGNNASTDSNAPPPRGDGNNNSGDNQNGDRDASNGNNERKL